MNYKHLIPVTIAALILSCGNATGQQSVNASEKSDSSEHSEYSEQSENSEVSAPSQFSVPPAAQKIIDAYPDQHLTYSDNYIVFPDGTKILFDDHREKSFEVMLDDCDIEDMLSMKYDPTEKVPAYLSDAGRTRCEAFFKKMYGQNEAEVRRNLVRVDWFGQSLPFTKVNHADEQLRKVAADIAKVPELKKYMLQSSTFYWRPVRGAKRLSAHSYGMTIDINTSYSNYWLWSNRGAGETTRGLKYENRIPEQIVEIFERHGFIWGGRWYHYDTMHFEYRPEYF